jgi:hypothetical protein
VVYLITHLTPQQASQERLLALIRGQWSIENSSHYVRAVTFQEDRSQFRSGQGPQIMAALRHLAITLIHRQGSSQIAARPTALCFSSASSFSLTASQKRRLTIIHQPCQVQLPDLKINPALSNNGGPTQTLELLQGSPAIDAVPGEACSIAVTDVSGHTVTITADQRGDLRPDGSEKMCDIGAYESSY